MALPPTAASPPAPAPAAGPGAAPATGPTPPAGLARAARWAPLALLAFVALLGLLVRGHNAVTDADGDLLTSVARQRPDWLVELAKVVTTFGRFDTLLVITVGAAFALVAWTTDPRRRADPTPSPWLLALTPLLALVLSGALNALTKAVVERPRPAEALRAVVEHGTGYSSGHSAHAAAVWIALALVLPAAHRRWWLTAGAGIAAGVGASRVIFAVHSPTDVLGGWALGLACALFAWQLTQRATAPVSGF